MESLTSGTWGQIVEQATVDGIPTFWVLSENLIPLLRHLKHDEDFAMLYDLTAIDERHRRHRDGQPASDFTVVYHLLSISNNTDIRIKVALEGDYPSIPSITNIWPTASWYEREVWDMYGVYFSNHPDLRRILSDYGFDGHPQRKDFPLSGYVETRYDAEKKRVVYEPVKLEQEFRSFDFVSPWEGTPYITEDAD